jgi:hypothetical protein
MYENTCREYKRSNSINEWEETKMVFEEGKAKLQALRIALDYQRRDNNSLNNILADLKVKYNIEDHDWLCISVAFSTLTSRDVIKKMGGGA